MKKILILFAIVFCLFLFACNNKKEETEKERIKYLFEYDTIEDYEVTDNLDIDGLFRLKEIVGPSDITSINYKDYHYFDSSKEINIAIYDREIFENVSIVLVNNGNCDVKNDELLSKLLNERYKVAAYSFENGLIFSFEGKYYYATTKESNIYKNCTTSVYGIWELEKVSFGIIDTNNMGHRDLFNFFDVQDLYCFIIDEVQGLIVYPTSIIEDGYVKIPVLSKYMYFAKNRDWTERTYATVQETSYGVTALCLSFVADNETDYYVRCVFDYEIVYSVSDKLTKEEEVNLIEVYIDYNPPQKDSGIHMYYYGIYKGGYVGYYKPNYVDFGDKPKTVTIGDYVFKYYENNELMYVKDGIIMTLKEAYDSKLLDDDDIDKIQDVFTYEPTIPTLKPIIYLYPTEDIDLVIKFKDPSRLLTTYPKYDDGWNVHVSKDSNIIIEGRSYYGLFFDEVSNYEPDFSEGFFVTKDNAISFLEESLNKMGFTEREACEFIMFWLPVLENNEMSLVYFEQTQERNEECPLELSVDFDTYLRVIIHIKKVNEVIDIKEQVLERVNRVGSCLVEWGGSNR